MRPVKKIRTVSHLLACAGAVAFLLTLPAHGVEGKKAQRDKVADKAKTAVKQFIFQEEKIEGKIRRPQMVLIKADQRPTFPPMIMQSMGRNDDIASFVDPSVFEKSTYKGPFEFKGTAIINYEP